MKGSVVIAGSIAQRPGYGGHAWALLQWLLGFRDAGWQVLFLDRLDPAMRGEYTGDDCTHAFDDILESRHIACFRDAMARFGLQDDASLSVDDTYTVGVSRSEVLERVGSADFLINIMGFLSDADVLARARRRAFLDIDPGFPQMWRVLGLHDAFAGYDDFITLGANIGQPTCRIPDCGLHWVTSRPPVVLEYWPRAEAQGGAFTTIGSWRGPFAPVEYDGESFGLRVHEFRRFMDLPARTGIRFEAALDMDDADRDDRDRLEAGRWSLVDPLAAAADVNAYQRFIRASGAEFMVAKNMYVRSRSGWFSDRSGAYLATGRPVLAQDTGLAGHVPTGEGLIVFDSIDEAAAGAESIAMDPARHERAARDIAVEYFDSRRIVAALADSLASRTHSCV